MRSYQSERWYPLRGGTLEIVVETEFIAIMKLLVARSLPSPSLPCLSLFSQANSGVVPVSVGYGAAMAPPQYAMAHIHHRRQLCDGEKRVALVVNIHRSRFETAA